MGIEFGSETTGCWFYIVNNSLVRLTRGLISLSNDNHVDNNLKKVREVKFNIRMSNVRFFFLYQNHSVQTKLYCSLHCMVY